MIALLALSVLAACGILPCIGAMRAAYLGNQVDTTQTSAAVDAHFDALQADFDRLRGVMHADGFLPDRRKTRRK